MTNLTEFAAAKLAALERQNLRRVLVSTRREDGVWVNRSGRRLVSFSCNDYLNLTHHPRVKRAAIDAIETYGTGAGASRLVTGNHPLFAALESRLALRKGAEASCLFGSGYLANAGTIAALIGKHDLIVIDELAHSCLWTGARLSSATALSFRHNDVSHAAELLAAARPRHVNALIVTESVFSMDGDLGPVAALSRLAQIHAAWLMVDDAHGLGAIAESSHTDADLQMGTLSKALASYGGYVCASRAVVELIATRARTLIYSTGLAPGSAAAALAALDIVESDPTLLKRPHENASLFTALCGLPPAQSAIVPVILGEESLALEAQQILEREGFLVVAIRPPTVPRGTARLRLAFTASHPEAEIERLAGIIRKRILPLARLQPSA